MKAFFLLDIHDGTENRLSMRKSDTIFSDAWNAHSVQLFSRVHGIILAQGEPPMIACEIYGYFLNASKHKHVTRIGGRFLMRLQLTFFGIRFYPLYFFHLKQEGRSAVSGGDATKVRPF
jgi:hypothetical protein